MRKSFTDALSGAMKDLDELNEFMSFCQASIESMEQSERMVTLTRKVVERLNPGATKDLEEYRRELGHAKRSTARAIQERETGFPYLFRLGVIWLWAIVEASLDDFAVSFLLWDNRWLKIEKLRGLKGSFFEFATASEEAKGEMLLGAIKREVAAPLKAGAGRFEEVLNMIGLGGPVDSDVARVLVEFSATRNLFVHRRGVIDRSFLQLCPWRNLGVNTTLHVSKAKYDAFYCACAWYNLELIARLCKSEDPEAEASAREPQEHFRVMMLKSLSQLPQ